MSAALALILAGLIAVSAGCGKKSSNAYTGDNNTLYVYNWGEYIDPDVIDMFEEETGINVVYDLFETNEEMYPVIAAGGVIYDAVCPSDYMIKKMWQNDLLRPIDYNNVPNITEIGEDFITMEDAYDPGGRYSVPYTWGLSASSITSGCSTNLVCRIRRNGRISGIRGLRMKSSCRILSVMPLWSH